MRLYELDNHSLWHLMLDCSGGFYTDPVFNALPTREEEEEEEGEEEFEYHEEEKNGDVKKSDDKSIP